MASYPNVTPGQVLTTGDSTTNTVQFADLQSQTTDGLQEQVAELEALVEYAMSVSPEFKRIVTGFRAKKRIGGNDGDR